MATDTTEGGQGRQGQGGRHGGKARFVNTRARHPSARPSGVTYAFALVFKSMRIRVINHPTAGSEQPTQEDLQARIRWETLQSSRAVGPGIMVTCGSKATRKEHQLRSASLIDVGRDRSVIRSQHVAKRPERR